MLRYWFAAPLFLAQTLSFVIPPESNLFIEPSLRSSQVATIDGYSVLPEDYDFSQDGDNDTPLPVVVWHGLGDAASADGMKEIAELIAHVNTGTYVHLVSLAQGDGDRSQSWFGDLNAQVDTVCRQIASDPILSTAPAINAIGFSQGGQFMRAYVERCGHWAPRVKTLMTFGSQHLGIGQFYKCAGWTDLLCNTANALLSTSLVWSDFIQKKVVPAQYYRPKADYDNYLAGSNFLADINNERKQKNATYAKNLSQLEKFVMIIFKDDTVVVPKESGWFADVDIERKKVTPMNETKLYEEDWIGLKKLDEKGALVFEQVEGGHMRLRDKDLRRLFKTYLGSVKSDLDALPSWQTEL